VIAMLLKLAASKLTVVASGGDADCLKEAHSHSQLVTY